MEYFQIKNRRMPWGDYGRILLRGMAHHLERKSGHIQLERTGPFIPDVIDSGISDIVISDRLKTALVNSGLPQLTFRKVMLARYVILP